MRRADRLFQLIQLLRDGRTWTAKRLAETLEVSDRTIYRDMQDLQASGLAIDGEAGVGYLLRDYDLPPLMFSRPELESLVLGARMVQAWGGERLAGAARNALDKITSVLPQQLAEGAKAMPLHAPSFHVSSDWFTRVDALFQAIQDRNEVEMEYRRQDGEASTRRVRPLGLFFWGGIWTLGGWCLLRSDFRSFRLDRILALSVSNITFAPENGRELSDFIASCQGQ